MGGQPRVIELGVAVELGSAACVGRLLPFGLGAVGFWRRPSEVFRAIWTHSV
jgi:hypothetical protein